MNLDNFPSDWEMIKLGNLLHDGARNGVYKPKEYHGSGLKIVNMGELFAYPRLHSPPMKRVRISDDEIERFTLKKNDLLFARRSLVAEGAGKCSIVHSVDEPTTFESSIIRLRPNPDKVDSEFLFYFFNSPQGKYLLDTILRQVAVSGITGKDLINLEIPRPSITEQKLIARIFSKMDDKMESNCITNSILESIARAIFKSWFIDFDPVHAKAEGRKPFGMGEETAVLFPDSFEEAELGRIPKGWHIGCLNEIADITMGQSPPGDTYNETDLGIPFYQGISDYGDRFPARRVFCTAPTRFAEKNDVLLSIRAPIGEFNIAMEKCSIGRGLAALHPKGDYSSYLFYSMRLNQSKWKEFEANGTVFGCATKDDVNSFKILMPPKELMQLFNNFIRPIDKLIEMHFIESNYLFNIRNTLLPKLLSGEIRIPESEEMEKVDA